jgi:hypothetical protein
VKASGDVQARRAGVHPKNTVDAVSITEQILRGRTVRERLDKLPDRPDGRGMFRDVQVYEFTAVMPEDDEYKQ